MKFAVVDLGTNTFHLLIVEVENDGWKELYRKRDYINLGEYGLDHLNEDVFNRALNTIKKMAGIIEHHRVDRYRMYATATLRSVDNADDFINEVKKQTGLDIDIISGEREAKLIIKGVKSCIPPNYQNYIVMDVGGGSVELSIVQGQDIHAESFPIGISILYNRFHKTEPMNESDIKKMDEFLSLHLSEFIQRIPNACKKYLVGCAGSFEILEGIVEEKVSLDEIESIEAQKCLPYMEAIARLNLEERIQRDDIPNERASLIVVAFLLIRHIITRVNFKTLLYSPYAMKEGMLFEMIEEYQRESQA